MKRIIIALCLIFVLVVTSAGAIQYYNSQSGNTSGGTNGHVTVVRRVYKDSVSYSGMTVTYYGVNGYVSTSNSINVTWTGSGKLYKTDTEDDLSAYTNNTNNYSNYNGLYGSDHYVTYSVDLNTNDIAFGTSTYHKNGSF